MKKKQTTGTPTEVQIMRDESNMTKHDMVSISLRSDTESVDSLIKKALKAVERKENHHSNEPRQEWIK